MSRGIKQDDDASQYWDLVTRLERLERSIVNQVQGAVSFDQVGTTEAAVSPTGVGLAGGVIAGLSVVRTVAAGRLVIVEFSAVFDNQTSQLGTVYRPHVDGANHSDANGGFRTFTAAGTSNEGVNKKWRLTNVSEGTHTFEIFVSSGSGTGTSTVTGPCQLMVVDVPLT